VEKTVIFDANNLFMRTFFTAAVEGSTPNPHYALWKYLSFESILEFIKKDLSITEVILAVDSGNNWRYEVFPRYKEARREARSEDEIVDWNRVFEEYHSFLNDVKENIPFKVLKVDRCEADDIIGTVCLNRNKNFIVVSNDEDYKQLISENVQVYTPKNNSFVENIDSERFLIQACLTGQGGKDGVFNIKTPLDWPNDKRKPGFGPKSAEKVIAEGYEKWLQKNNLVERFNINRTLIDLKCIPTDLQQEILHMYDNYNKASLDKIYTFFQRNNWKSYLEEFTYIENRLMLLY